jgi:hypothetical protein
LGPRVQILQTIQYYYNPAHPTKSSNAACLIAIFIT